MLMKLDSTGARKPYYARDNFSPAATNAICKLMMYTEIGRTRVGAGI